MKDLELTKRGIRFVSRETERCYRAWHVQRAVPFTRIGMIAALVGWGVGGVAIWTGVPEIGPRAMTWIVLGLFPVIFAALAVSYSRLRDRWMLPLTALANALAGWVALALFAVLLHKADLLVGAISAIAFYGFTIFRLGPRVAVLATVPYLVGTGTFVARQWMAGRLPFANFAIGETLLATSFEAGLLVCVVFDRVSRDAYRQERIIERQRVEIERERDRADGLLANILPAPIAARLKDGEEELAEYFEGVSVIFADVVGFTVLATKVTPERLVAILNRIFSTFDELAEQYRVEKIKTIGDAYMAVAGIPERRDDHADAAARMALAMREAIAALAPALGIRLRIGIASGPAVAGVIGKRKFAYDLWGDTVNTASRMESHGLVDAIHLAESTRTLLGERFKIEDRGTIEIKGKGPMRTYVLLAEVRGP